MTKFSDALMSWLRDENYTHCFFLAGGGSMHLIDSASRYFECIPVIHEVSAVIATEYFNESNEYSKKAFALVTTGPGLTNAITGIAGAWLESRECLVIGGQVKKADLATVGLRQRGIQEINGIDLVSSITKARLRITEPVSKKDIDLILNEGSKSRKGPVFIEICIDASATKIQEEDSAKEKTASYQVKSMQSSNSINGLQELLRGSNRPLLLLGSGVDRKKVESLEHAFAELGVPIASTWTGADRISCEYEFYAGRPNTYGMRWANVFQQQADLLIAVGTRLNLQQTGFNYQEFMPVGKIIQVDIDSNELEKPNPGIDLGINMDSGDFLEVLLEELKLENGRDKRQEWLDFLTQVRDTLPVVEDCHMTKGQFVEPYSFINELSLISRSTDVIIPCSSGGTFTATHQSYLNKRGQQIISNKGLASMGYGLAGAIGAAFSQPNSRIILFEGDGGFAQNLQELGTVMQNNLNIKIFVFSNEGYASIRTSQISYFNGNYVGCDGETGLGLPNWELICDAYGVEHILLNNKEQFKRDYLQKFEQNGPVFFEIATDPDMLYFPKVASKINSDGQMVSAAIHDMTPQLSKEIAPLVFKYITPISQEEN
jgi:acetolactate synthase I/II/III large subunit